VIGLDTNVLVRYLSQDDPIQAAAANALIEGTLTTDSPGFISIVVLAELVWVLEAGYRCDRTQVCAVLEQLLRAKALVVEHADVAWRALRQFASSKADFADCLIERAGHANSCEYTVTFDRLAARHAGMRALPIR